MYGSVQEAGDDSYDAAIVMVPHHLHVEIAREVLLKGKHVLLEKPLAISIEGCRELLALAQSTDRVFMVAENSPHWPEVKDQTWSHVYFLDSEFFRLYMQ